MESGRNSGNTGNKQTDNILKIQLIFIRMKDPRVVILIGVIP